MLLISQTLDCALAGRMPESSSRFEKDPRPVIVWNVNNQCNMTCAHCYASAVRRRTESRDISTEECRQIVDRLADWGVRNAIFSGGEPMLREDLFALLEYAVSRGITPQLATNGVRITKERAARFRDTGVSMVEVGLDGKPETNDAYRGMHGGFSRALDGLRYLREAGLGTSIRITVHQKNRADLMWLLDLAVQEEFTRFHLSHLLYSGRADAASDERSPDAREHVFLLPAAAADKHKVRAGRIFRDKLLVRLEKPADIFPRLERTDEQNVASRQPEPPAKFLRSLPRGGKRDSVVDDRHISGCSAVHAGDFLLRVLRHGDEPRRLAHRMPREKPE